MVLSTLCESNEQNKQADYRLTPTNVISVP